MSIADRLSDTAAEEGWTLQTQLDLLVSYIENQQSESAFQDFLDEHRAEEGEIDV